ncbi:hypothetical protein ACHAXS_003838 [Conticribra weissflogii]
MCSDNNNNHITGGNECATSQGDRNHDVFQGKIVDVKDQLDCLEGVFALSSSRSVYRAYTPEGTSYQRQWPSSSNGKTTSTKGR